MEPFRCLSVRQPWASLICVGQKKVENRSWPTDFRGTIAVHASASKTDLNAWLRTITAGTMSAEMFPTGAIVGVVDLVDVVPLSPSIEPDPHATGPQCWLLDNGRVLPRPIPLKGKLNLFHLSADISAQIYAQLAEPPPKSTSIASSALAQSTFDDCQRQVWRAQSYAALGEFRQAIRCLNIALADEPKEPDLYRMRAGNLAELGEHVGAIADCDKVIELCPEDALAYALRGDIKHSIGDTAGAEADQKRALQLDPGLADQLSQPPPPVESSDQE